MIGDIIYLIMILLGALIGLAYFKICTLSFKFLSILLAYTFISESIATYMRHINKNPTFLMALYTPIHVIFITLIYYNLLKISKSKFAIAFIGIGFFSFAILKTINYRNYQLPTQLIMADCIMVVFFAILLYYDLIKNPIETQILLSAIFWLNTSLMIYFTGNFIFWAFYSYLKTRNIILLSKLENITLILDPLLYLMLIVAIFLHINDRKLILKNA